MFAAALESMQASLCPAGCGHHVAAPVLDNSTVTTSCTARCRQMTIRAYLSAVYPTAAARFASVPDGKLADLLNTLDFFYDHGCSYDRSHCRREPGVLLRWLYADLLPCSGSPSDCAAKHSKHSPAWIPRFDTNVGWIEVEHRRGGIGKAASESREASAQGMAMSYAYDSGSAATQASAFLDPGLGMWYTYRRGSGVFYRLGRAKRAPGKTAMMADLLREVALSSVLSAGWPQVAAALSFNSTNAGWDALRLRALSAGKRTCHSLRIRLCRCGSTLPDSWDTALIWAARGLGYDTLLFSATLLCRQGSSAAAAFPELVDARPLDKTQSTGNLSSLLEASESGNGTNEVESHLRRKKRDVALRLVQSMRDDNVLSLRDPDNVRNEAAALPCHFSTHAMGLSCAGHLSSAWQASEWAQCGMATLSCGHHGPWAAQNIPKPSMQALSPSTQQSILSPLLATAVPVPMPSPPAALPFDGHQMNRPVNRDPPSALGSDASSELTDVSMDSVVSRGGRVYRFLFTRVRGSDGQQRVDGLQLAEVKLFSAHGELLPVTVALNPNGERPYRHQSAPAAVDGSLLTKWFDANLVTSEAGAVTSVSKLVLALGPGANALASYQFFSANDNPRRDPVSWTLQLRMASAAEPTSTWQVIDAADSIEAPLERRAPYERRWLRGSEGKQSGLL